ncbi:hypothetical protein BH23CHL8_BH23CHL8_12360 [soil metagenome]
MLLAFFAVGMDALHFLSGAEGRLLGLVEDGGQLVVLSVILAHAVAHLAAARSSSDAGGDA